MRVCRRILWLNILCSFAVKISAYVAAGEGAAHDHNFFSSDETPLRNLQGGVAAQGEKMSTLTSRASSDRATVAAQAKVLEERLGRLEKQDSKFSELIAELNHKIAEQDSKIAAQAIDLSALRERDVEREAQIATLKRRLQEREEDERRRALQSADRDDAYGAGGGGVKEAGVGPDGQPQSRRRATAST